MQFSGQSISSIGHAHSLTECALDKVKCRVFDFGGTRNERNKWMSAFESVDVVLMASLSCFDRVMFEDHDKNWMQDQLQLLKQICESEWLVDTQIVLLLSKVDLLSHKLGKRLRESPRKEV